MFSTATVRINQKSTEFRFRTGIYTVLDLVAVEVNVRDRYRCRGGADVAVIVGDCESDRVRTRIPAG